MTDVYHELLAILSETSGRIRALMEQGIDQGPAGSTDDWGPAAVVAHLVDSEKLCRGRMQRMLTQNSPYMKSFDQEAAAREGDYGAQELRPMLEAFATERAETISLLMNLSLKDWNRSGIHETLGEISIEDIAEQLIDHDAEHLAQLEELKSS